MVDSVAKESEAKKNLRKGFSSPGAKVAVVTLVVLALGLGGWGLSRMRSSSGPSAGAAQAGGFEMSGGKPRGATDAATAGAVANAADQTAANAASRGQSYGGPFVFEGASVAGDSGVAGAPPQRDQSADVIAALRRRAAEYDATEDANPQSQANSNQRNDGASSNSAGQGDYGMGPDGFKQITGQLARAGSAAMRYESLPNGVLLQPPAAPAAAARIEVATGAATAASPPTNNTSPASSQKAAEMIAARAGSTCAGAPDAKVDTDVNLPVFVSLLDCGELTGAKVKGTIVKGPENFTVRFTTLYPDPARKVKVNGAIDAVAVNIAKDGDPAIADDVNKHWFTRLASSALLRLAKTEQQFIANRSTTNTSTGFSSSTTVEPPTDSQKRDARIAGVLEGTMEVVTGDVAAGVNRQATMTTNKTTLIGVQFLDDVKVTRID